MFQSPTAISSPITIIIGNEASDLDSIVSSIALAFFFNHSEQGIPLDNRYLPILNINRSDLCLRTETTWLFSKLASNVQLDDLFLFIEDEAVIKLIEHAKKNQFSVILTDHNRLAEHQSKAFQDHITHIFDHHFPENL